MKFTALLYLCFAALTGCVHTTTVYEVSVGYNVGSSTPWGSNASDFAGPREVASFSVDREHTSGVFCGYQHISHLTSGRPFNQREEDVLDWIKCGYRLRRGE